MSRGVLGIFWCILVLSIPLLPFLHQKIVGYECLRIRVLFLIPIGLTL